MFASSGSLVGPLGAHLVGVSERSWTVSEASRTILEASWDPLGRHRRRGTSVWGLCCIPGTAGTTGTPGARGRGEAAWAGEENESAVALERRAPHWPDRRLMGLTLMRKCVRGCSGCEHPRETTYVRKYVLYGCCMYARTYVRALWVLYVRTYVRTHARTYVSTHDDDDDGR